MPAGPKSTEGWKSEAHRAQRLKAEAGRGS